MGAKTNILIDWVDVPETRWIRSYVCAPIYDPEVVDVCLKLFAEEGFELE